jgi:hypothetical protein
MFRPHSFVRDQRKWIDSKGDILQTELESLKEVMPKLEIALGNLSLSDEKVILRRAKNCDTTLRDLNQVFTAQRLQWDTPLKEKVEQIIGRAEALGEEIEAKVASHQEARSLRTSVKISQEKQALKKISKSQLLTWKHDPTDETNMMNLSSFILDQFLNVRGNQSLTNSDKQRFLPSKLLQLI